MVTMNTPIFINPNGDNMTLLDVDNLFCHLADLLIAAKHLCNGIVQGDAYEEAGRAKALMLVLDAMKVNLGKIAVSSTEVGAPDKEAA